MKYEFICIKCKGHTYYISKAEWLRLQHFYHLKTLSQRLKYNNHG